MIRRVDEIVPNFTLIFDHETLRRPNSELGESRERGVNMSNNVQVKDGIILRKPQNLLCANKDTLFHLTHPLFRVTRRALREGTCREQEFLWSQESLRRRTSLLLLPSRSFRPRSQKDRLSQTLLLLIDFV